MYLKPTVFIFCCFFVFFSYAQSSPEQYNRQLFTTPLSYAAVRTPDKITIDGNLSESGWQQSDWSAAFTDIEGDVKPKPAFETKMKMLWDDTCLYVAAWLQEPQLNASLRQHDTIIFQDNDFEIFIDPDNDTHRYFEIEINGLNTIFDLFMPKPYRNGSDALIGYDVQGLQSAVSLHGTVNNFIDTDSGWIVEMAIPFHSINFGFRKSFTPQEGEFYRINFSRVEWDWDIANGKYVKRKDAAGKSLPEHNWVWSPQGLINMHYPERWGYLFFVNDSNARAAIPEGEELKNYLWLLYYKQKEYYSKQHRYATSLSQINIPSSFVVNGNSYKLSLQSLSNRFEAAIINKENQTLFTIDEDGEIRARP